MIDERELNDLRESEKKDYFWLPCILKKSIDKRIPRPDRFESPEEELMWLIKRQSRLSSMWMGIYSFIMVLTMGVVCGSYELVNMILEMFK